MNTMPVFYLSAPLDLEPATGDALPARLSGIAYSGGLIEDFGAPLAIDLATTALPGSIPLLYEHDRTAVIGSVETLSAADGERLDLTARLFADIDPQAETIARKAKAGIRWQLSIGLFGAHLEEASASTEINHRTFSAPLSILRGGTVREVSIVALGADPNTSTDFFAAFARPPQTENTPMPEAPDLQARIDALEAQVADLSRERDAAVAAKTDAEAEAAEVKLAARTDAVQALFAEIGRPFSAESAALYLALPDDAWSAIAADMRAMKPKAPAHLFSEQATGEPAAPKPAIDVAAIYANRRAA